MKRTIGFASLCVSRVKIQSTLIAVGNTTCFSRKMQMRECEETSRDTPDGTSFAKRLSKKKTSMKIAILQSDSIKSVSKEQMTVKIYPKSNKPINKMLIK